jgi:PcRGLX-like N-terminal RIFT barrel domain
MLLTLAIPLSLLHLAAVDAGQITRIPITVRETAGLRRFGYPVSVAVPFPKGALVDVRHVRLLDGQSKEVGAQVTVMANWPGDGSVQWVDVDFNASPAPNATEKYAVEYGPGVERSGITRGVILTETLTAYQAGAYRVPKDGRPLLSSVHYGELEYLRPEGAEFLVVDRSGAARTVREGSVRTRALKTEPVSVMLEQRGEYAGERGALAFRTTMAFPNSKSWIHFVHEIEDPGGEVREVVLRLPFALETEPRIFDFGVGSWLYGTLRTGQAATLTQRVAPATADSGKTNWNVTLGGAADAPPFAVGVPATGSNRAEGWGHLMDGKKVVALGVPGFAAVPGESSIRLDHDGNCVIRWRPDRPATGGSAPCRVEAFFHFVPVPPQVTAVTSPPSMLSPLVARCSPEYYQTVGVAAPR